MSKQLLVVIDPQNDFTHTNGMYAQRHSGITSIVETKDRINKLLNSFDSKKTVIIQSNYQPDQFNNGLSICALNSFGHEIDADLRYDKGVRIIAKSDHNCFSSPAFKKYLETHQIDTLILCGFLAEYCVKETALHALGIGYRVVLVEDCIATGDDVQYRKEQSLSALKKLGAFVINSGEIAEG